LAEERPHPSGEATLIFTIKVGHVNADLTIGADLTAALALRANKGICSPGVKLHGAGFIVTPHEAQNLGLGRNPYVDAHIRRYLHGKDLMGRPRGVMVIDLFGLDAEEARSLMPAVFQHVYEHVKPERDVNPRESRRNNWWLFGEPNPKWRQVVSGIPRFISTPETAKHRVFVFLDATILPDNMLVNIGTEDAFFLGALSSRLHVVWALAAGGRMGVGNDPRYSKTRCFDPFPFPWCAHDLRQRIRDLGEQLDLHRKRQQALHPDLTITGMYNVLEKLRSGDALSEKERVIHEDGLVSVLKQIHDDLDAAVFTAYGWPHDLSDEAILERLVALNAERAEEERRGLVRWLRPAFQNPAGVASPGPTQELMDLGEEMAPEAAASPEATWPKELPRQIAAVRDLVSADRARAGWSATETARAFRGARTKDVEPVLDSLAAVGLLVAFDTAKGRRWQPSV